MIFASFIAYIRDRLAKRREYNRLTAEIWSLSDRDVADLRADRGEMLSYARQQVYG